MIDLINEPFKLTVQLNWYHNRKLKCVAWMGATEMLREETRRDREGVNWFAQKELIIIVVVVASYYLRDAVEHCKRKASKWNWIFISVSFWLNLLGKYNKIGLICFSSQKRCPMKWHIVSYFQWKKMPQNIWLQFLFGIL